MKTDIFSRLISLCLLLAVIFAGPARAADGVSATGAQIDYSRDPAILLISFREVYPEFADQDPTPLIRIYGDGRVVVFHAAYMKQAGRYEMLLSNSELESLLLELTAVLLSFDEEDVKRQKRAVDDLVWEETSDWEDLTLFHTADAEFSVFHLNIEMFQPTGPAGPTISRPELDRVWRGLRHDAENYPGLEPIEALMQAENMLRALTGRVELVRVGSYP